MLGVHIENIGDLAVIECEGRIVRSDAAFKLRDALTSQLDAHIIVVDLSEVNAIEGGGLGMLAFLHRWAFDHDIQFKLFNPSSLVQLRLEQANFTSQLDIATLDEMKALLGRAETSQAQADRGIHLPA